MWALEWISEPVPLPHYAPYPPRRTLIIEPAPEAPAPPPAAGALPVRAVLRGHQDEVAAAAFSPDGRILAAVSRDGVVKIWDVAARREAVVLRERMSMVETAFRASRSRPRRVRMAVAEVKFAFSNDSKTLVAADSGGKAIAWDLASGTETIPAGRLHQPFLPNFAIAFPGEGPFLVGKTYVGGHPVRIRLRMWDLATGLENVPLSKPLDGERTFAISHDGRTLALAHQWDGIARIWNIPLARKVFDLDTHQRGWFSFAFSHDDKVLATARGDFDRADVMLWDLRTGREKISLKGQVPSEEEVFAFSPDDRSLLTASRDDPQILVWGVDSGMRREIPPSRFRQRHGAFDSVLGRVVISPRGTLYTACRFWDDEEVFLRDWSTGRTIARLERQTLAVFSPDARLLATAGIDHSATLWEVPEKD
jgi:WD40 repeat protein